MDDTPRKLRLPDWVMIGASILLVVCNYVVVSCSFWVIDVLGRFILIHFVAMIVVVLVYLASTLGEQPLSGRTCLAALAILGLALWINASYLVGASASV